MELMIIGLVVALCAATYLIYRLAAKLQVQK
jgi:F0F1-type ATP synthase assembly protein I